MHPSEAGPPSGGSQAASSPSRGWRIARAVLGASAIWIGADLLLGLRLPLASVLEQLAFAAVVELPVYAIFTAPVLIPLLLAVGGLSWWGRERWAPGWVAVQELAQAALWGAACTVSLVGILKLRPLGLALLVTVVLAAVFWSRRPGPRRFDGRAAAAVALGPLLVAGTQLHAFVWSDRLWRKLVARIEGGASPEGLMLLPTVLAGLGLLLVVLGPVAFERLTTGRLVPRWAPRLILGALLAGQIGHAQSFAGSYFSLWDAELPPGMERLDDNPARVHPEAFRLAVSDDGRWLLVVYRQSTRLVRFDLSAGTSQELGLELPGEGTLENVVWDEVERRFLVSFDLDDPTATDWLVSIDEGGGSELLELANHGWIASMVLDGRDLVLGYEARPKLVSFDLERRAVRSVQVIRSLGDVEEAVVADGRLYTVPLHHPWGLHLSEVDLEAGAVRRRLLIGGANQELEATASRFFVGRYYASRIAVVDRAAWQLLAPISVGFGVRGIAVDEERGLLVSGGQFEGWIRVHEIASGRLLARVPSCGYVKDLLVHDGDLLFSGLCGVYRVDLDTALRGAR